MNRNILRSEVQKYLNDHRRDDVQRIALSKSPFDDVSARELAEQIDGRKRAERKLPLWYSTEGIIFPPKLNLEQSSSESTAFYKAKLVKGTKLIDLTGGFGVDTYYFSKVATEVIHCEVNEDLSALAEHNLNVLKRDNIRFIHSDSIQFLSETVDQFDTIYVDPSRRIATKKVFMLQYTEPDVISNLSLLLSKANRLLIKTSPLFDLQSGLKELSHVSEIHVVSVNNECKELLWVVEKGFDAEPQIHCAALGISSEQHFSFSLSQEKRTLLEYHPVRKFLYEPDASLLKAGCFKSITSRFDILKLDKNTHLYTSEMVKDGFMGKIFEVRKTESYKDFIKTNTTRKANVLSRNFPNSPEEIKKKHKIQDGGDEFLVFTTVFPGNLQVIHCRHWKKEHYPI